MKIATHRDLINAVTQTVISVCDKKMDAFERGLCFGYAATFIEALHEGSLSQFDARMRADLDESVQARQQFFFGMAVHQFPFLFPDELPPDKNRYLQNICLTSRSTKGGGLRTLFHHAGCYDESGFIQALSALQEIMGAYQCHASFILDAGKHSIALSLNPNSVRLATASKPSELMNYSFKTSNDIVVLSKKIHALLTVVSTIEAAPRLTHHLVIRWQWVCSRDDYLDLIPARNALRKHFYENQIPAPALLSLPDKKNQTWIIAALKTQDVSLIRKMIEVYPDLKEMINDHMTLLSFTVFNGLLDSMRALLQAGCDPNKIDESGYQPLWFVIDYATVEYMNVLLLFGADKNLTCARGYTPLKYAEALIRKEEKPSLRTMLTELQSGTKHFLMQP